MTIGKALELAGTPLELAGSKTPRLDGLVLLAFVLRCSTTHLRTHPDLTVPTAAYRQFKRLLAKRCDAWPIAYLTGKVEFYSLDIEVTLDVLIPRPESEALVETAVKLTPTHGCLLDVGTGSGAIAVAIKSHRPDLSVTGSDISAPALKVATNNATKHRAAIKFINSDLLTNVKPPFSTIIANLPYLPHGYPCSPETEFEPKTALYAGSDGLDLYRKFFQQLAAMAETEMLGLECLPEQLDQITQMASEAGFSKQRRLNDFCSLFVRL